MPPMEVFDVSKKSTFYPDQAREALDVIADYGQRADLPNVLAERFGAKFSLRFGKHEVRMAGVYAASRTSARAALDMWGNAARRKLLAEGGA